MGKPLCHRHLHGSRQGQPHAGELHSCPARARVTPRSPPTPAHSLAQPPGTPRRLRLTIPNRKGAITVNVEVFEVLLGKHITDLSKVSGNTGAGVQGCPRAGLAGWQRCPRPEGSGWEVGRVSEGILAVSTTPLPAGSLLAARAAVLLLQLWRSDVRSQGPRTCGMPIGRVPTRHLLLQWSSTSGMGISPAWWGRSSPREGPVAVSTAAAAARAASAVRGGRRLPAARPARPAASTHSSCSTAAQP